MGAPSTSLHDFPQGGEETLNESTPLIQSGTILSYNSTLYYTYHQTTSLDNEYTRSEEKLESSIISGYETSVFWKSIQLSSYSSVTTKQSKDCIFPAIKYEGSVQKCSLSSESVMFSLIEKVTDSRETSSLLAVGNILPFLMPSAVFSMPFTIATGGYATIAAIILVSVLADLTGLILIDCLYEISPNTKLRKRVRLDYDDIAVAAWGKHGSRLTYLIQVCYLYATVIIALLILGKSFHAVLDSCLQDAVPLPPAAITGIISIAVIPTLFTKKVSHLGYFSLLSIISLVIGMIAVTAVFVQHNAKWAINASKIPVFSSEDFMLGLSIMSYTLIAHPVLPQIEGSMRNRSKYKSVIHFSYGFSSVLKIIIGVLGALTFGPATSSLVSLNVSKLNRPIAIVSNLVLGVYATFIIPLELFVVSEAFDAITLKENSKFKNRGRYRYIWILLTRPLMVAIGLGIAVSIPYFGLLIGVLGSLLGTLLAYIFPCLFHIQLKWKNLSRCQILSETLLMLLGTVTGATGVYASVRGLVLAFTGESVID